VKEAYSQGQRVVIRLKLSGVEKMRVRVKKRGFNK